MSELVENEEPEYIRGFRITQLPDDEKRMIFYTHPDGEQIEYWHPVASTAQGSTIEERQKGHSRVSKDRKEFRKVRRLNSKHRIPFIQLLKDAASQADQKESLNSIGILQSKLSLLGARYPTISGLGIYIRGLGAFEGKGEAKKFFDFLFYISSLPDLKSAIKFLVLSPIGKIIFNRHSESPWIQTDRTMFSMLGLNELANDFGRERLNFNRSAIEDSLRNGKKIAEHLYIEFYSNTTMYEPKIRRRGYSRSSPRASLSKTYSRKVTDHSFEALRLEGTYYQNEQGEWIMNKKPGLHLPRVFSVVQFRRISIPQ